MKNKLIAGGVAGVFLFAAAWAFGPEVAQGLFGTVADFVTGGMGE